MMQNKKTKSLVRVAVIAAMYAALTYAQSLLLPGTTTAAVQFRASEAMNVLALFFPEAIFGLTLGCVFSNLYSIGQGLPLDMIFGCMYLLRNRKIKNYPLLSMLMPAVWNGVIVGWEIEFFFVEGKFHLGDFLFQGGCVALGELGVMAILGTLLYYAMIKRGLDKKL